MLTQSEAKVSFETLSKIAVKNGLHWLMDDVKLQISLGKEQIRNIRVQNAETNFSHEPSKKRPQFVISEPYDEREKLKLLVDALEAVSVGLSKSTIKIFDLLQNFNVIEFTPDVSHTEESRSLAIEKSYCEKRDQIEKLEKLVNELKDEI
jgi:hypothetical protein